MASSFDIDKQHEIELSTRIPYIVRLLTKHPCVHKCALSMPQLDTARVKLNTQLLEQAVLNLILNASQAADAHAGKIELSLKRVEHGVMLQVDDNGHGIPSDLHQDIFTPGYTTKADGSGLGLLCVQAFVDSCGGKIKLEQSTLGGASFQIFIPDNTASQAATMADAESSNEQQKQNEI